MQAKRIASALIALTMMAGSTAAFAQPGPRDDHRGRPGYDHRGPDHRDTRGPHRGPDRGPGRGPDHGRDWDHHWKKGERVPAAYRSRVYVVDNWRAHRLSAPPRGHQWIQSGADYLLIAVATGLVVSVLSGR